MRKPKPPKLTPLRYGNPYCESCGDTLRPGMLVAWWPTRSNNGKTRKAVWCAACHHDKTRALHPKQRR